MGRELEGQAGRWQRVGDMLFDGSKDGVSPYMEGITAAFESEASEKFNQHMDGVRTALATIKAAVTKENPSGPEVVCTMVATAEHGLYKVDEANSGETWEAGVRGYNVGFGDGWHTGIIALVRLFVAAPTPSKALSLLLNLGPVRQADTDRAAKAIDQALGEQGDPKARRMAAMGAVCDAYGAEVAWHLSVAVAETVRQGERPGSQLTPKGKVMVREMRQALDDLTKALQLRGYVDEEG